MFCDAPPSDLFFTRNRQWLRKRNTWDVSDLLLWFECLCDEFSFCVCGGEESNTGMKTAYPLVLGTNLAMKSVLRNAVLDDIILFLLSLCWNPLKCLPTAISQNLVFISYDQGIMTHVEWCSLVTHFSPEIDNNDFEDETYEPIFFFWHEPSRTAMHHSPH